jgi:hypothetical protein
MPRFKNALTIIKDIAQVGLKSPRCTLDALKIFPSMVRGLQYCRSGSFPGPAIRNNFNHSEINPLLDYFNAHKEGPGLWKSLHYFDIYHRHFKKFIGRDVNVLEIGIYSGGSLEMWRQYFGKGCHIYGVDIVPACTVYKSDKIDVFIGDQADRNFWKRFKEAVPKIDILIDDGGHDPEQQIITLEEMFPHIQPGGVYLCEDIGSKANSFGGYVSGLACALNAAKKTVEVFDAPIIPSAFQATANSVIQYPFVTVIEKHEHAFDLFKTEKHGTKWQPY